MTRLAVLAIALVAASTAAAHGVIEPRLHALDEAIAAAPGDAMLYLSRGMASRERGDWDAALADFRKAAALSPDSSEAQVLTAATLHDAGQADQGLEILDRVIATNPNNSDALLERARSYRAQRQWLNAAADLDAALSLMDPVVPEVIVARADVLYAAGPDHVTEAINTLEHGIERLGPVVSLVRRLVELSLTEARYATGLGALDRLPDTVARQPKWLIRRADLLLADGNVNAARNLYLVALDGLMAIPVSRRSTRAMTALETDLRLRLETLDEGA